MSSRNRRAQQLVNKLPRKTQTAIKDSAAENCIRKKYLSNDVSIM